jgi:hypothetical protein
LAERAASAEDLALAFGVDLRNRSPARTGGWGCADR